MSFVFNCSFCDESLEVDEKWQGAKIVCPACGKEVIVRNKSISKNENTLNDKKSPNRYRWGRRFIVLARYFASLIIIGGVLFCGGGVNDVIMSFANKNREIKSSSDKLVEKFRDFDNRYNELLFNLKSKFPKDDEITYIIRNSQNDPLTNFTSMGSVEKGEAKLNSYSKGLNDIGDYLQKKLFKDISSFDQKTDVSNVSKSPSTRNSAQNVTRNIISIMKNKEDFFVDNNSAMTNINNSKRLIAALRLAASSSTDRYLLTQWDQGLVLLEKDFVGDVKITSFEKISESVADDNMNFSQSSKKPTVTEQRYRELKRYLSGLLTPAVENSANWTIAKHLIDLQREMKVHKELCSTYSTKKHNEMVAVVMAITPILLSAFILAFMTFVMADYLQAHFDVADLAHGRSREDV